MKTLTLRVLSVCLSGALISGAALAVTPVHKCVANGVTTFQRDPCPPSQNQAPPTTQQLNQERKKKAEAAEATRSQQPPQPRSQNPSPVPQESEATTPTRSPERPAPSPQFRCDARKYCSQMTSCAEAKYFLANCPGVKMDGDGDGIPCEMQWCSQR